MIINAAVNIELTKNYSFYTRKKQWLKEQLYEAQLKNGTHWKKM
jgi:hypothetical protein